jgi:hypothetical protein
MVFRNARREASADASSAIDWFPFRPSAGIDISDSIGRKPKHRNRPVKVQCAVPAQELSRMQDDSRTIDAVPWHDARAVDAMIRSIERTTT